MTEVMRCSLRNVVNRRLSTGLKKDRLLLMCEVVTVLRSEINEDRIGSIGWAGGSQGTLFSTIGMVVENAFRNHSNEIKQLSGLVILKTGLGVQECKIMSQKAQDDAYVKNLKTNYDALKLDAIYGGRITAVPLKFLSIGTSRAKEVMSGNILRKRYSAMKSYINNVLTPLWRK